jgi:hypothetical protein
MECQLQSLSVKATVGLDVHTETLTKHSGLNGNEKGSVPLGNPTLPKIQQRLQDHQHRQVFQEGHWPYYIL